MVELYYNEALSVMEFLMDKFGKDNFVKLCHALKERKPFDQAVNEAYRVYKDLEELNKAWFRYIKMIKPGQHIHFIGIGGIGMSGIASILLKQGYAVSGSDLKESPIIRRLAESGAGIFYGHSPANINGADVVVYSSAIRKITRSWPIAAIRA